MPESMPTRIPSRSAPGSAGAHRSGRDRFPLDCSSPPHVPAGALTPRLMEADARGGLGHVQQAMDIVAGLAARARARVRGAGAPNAVHWLLDDHSSGVEDSGAVRFGTVFVAALASGMRWLQRCSQLR